MATLTGEGSSFLTWTCVSSASRFLGRHNNKLEILFESGLCAEPEEKPEPRVEVGEIGGVGGSESEAFRDLNY